MKLPQPKLTKHALGFLFFVILLDVIGLGIIIPVLPQLLIELTGRAENEVALLGGYLLFAYAGAQFVMSPILGGISDRFGRRPVILFSLLGYAVDFTLMALAPTYAWLFLGRMLSGAFAATYATSYAFIADVSPPEKRAGNFGLLGAAFGIGFILGPLLGGVLGEIDTRLPFFAAAAIAFANFVYGIFVLPESLPAEKRRKFELKRANPLGSLLQLRTYPIVLGVLLSYFLMQVAHNSLPAIWSYFSTVKFGWTPRDIGLSLVYVGVTAAFVQGYLTRKLIPVIGERTAVHIGLIAMTVSFMGYAFLTPTGGWVYLWITVGAAGGFMMPGMQGLMSRATPENAQGELQGAIASVMSITMLVSPLSMTWIFDRYTADDAAVYFPGAPFLVSGVILLTALVPFWLTLSKAELRSRAANATKETNEVALMAGAKISDQSPADNNESTVKSTQNQ
ncbi:MAG: TCR/Tet family MFS transporter [Aquisalinus sp.]|nr:TCR/Tet family MFS transporter [Aquisalinus sp.]